MGFIGHPKVINGQCLSSTVAADCGLWTADYGLRTAHCALRTADYGLRTAHCGLEFRTANWGLQGTRSIYFKRHVSQSRFFHNSSLGVSNFWKTNKKVSKLWSVCLFVCFITVWAYLDPFNQHLWTEVAKLLGGEWIATCTDGLFLSQKELRAIIISGGCWS